MAYISWDAGVWVVGGTAWLVELLRATLISHSHFTYRTVKEVGSDSPATRSACARALGRSDRAFATAAKQLMAYISWDAGVWGVGGTVWLVELLRVTPRTPIGPVGCF